MDLQQYAEYVGRSLPVHWIDGLPWRVSRRMLEPICPPHMMQPVNRQKIQQVMRQSGALLARWVDDWDTPPCDWWYVCCDDPLYDIEHVPSHSRRKKIRRGLRNCEVRRVPLDEFLTKGYPVYQAASRLYTGHFSMPSRQRFEDGAREAAESDAWETWGAFHDGELAAFFVCIVIGDMVARSSSKSDPAHHKANPNDAASFTLTKHYLQDRKMRYISAGARSVYHETNVQELLLSQGYRQVHCPIRVEIDRKLAAVIASGVGKWGKYLGLSKLLRGQMATLQALSALVRIAKACEHILPARQGQD